MQSSKIFTSKLCIIKETVIKKRSNFEIQGMVIFEEGSEKGILSLSFDSLEIQLSQEVTQSPTFKSGTNETYLQNINRVTDVENKLMATRGKRGRDKLGDWD